MGNGEMVFYRVKKVKGNYYLIKEWYDPELKKKITRSISPCRLIEELMVKIKKENMVRGVGFEPTQAYAIGASARPLCPSSGTPALQ